MWHEILLNGKNKGAIVVRSAIAAGLLTGYSALAVSHNSRLNEASFASVVTETLRSAGSRIRLAESDDNFSMLRNLSELRSEPFLVNRTLHQTGHSIVEVFFPLDESFSKNYRGVIVPGYFKTPGIVIKLVVDSDVGNDLFLANMNDVAAALLGASKSLSSLSKSR